MRDRFAFSCNRQPFLFYNLQGDVIAITDSSAVVVARYSYDAWGACTITSDTSGCNISAINPYRYRTYYYDSEIGLYYLQSRYYDPVVGRFICGDSKLGINCGISSYMLYCYCGNNPICRIDPLGCAWWSVLCKLVAVVLAVVTVAHIANASMSISQADYNKSHDKHEIISDQNDVDMKFGCKWFSEMGCGAAATHNAIILAGGSSSLAEIVEYMQAHDLTLGFGGVYFTNIQLYLSSKGYPNKLHMLGSKNNIDRKIKDSSSKVAILAYKHSTSGHYVAIKYDDNDKKFYVYNTNRIIDSVDSWISSKSYKPLCLITI